MNDIKIKKNREKIGIPIPILDAIRCFMYIFAVLFMIYMATGGEKFTSKHLLFFFICAVLLSILYAYAVERIGSGLGSLLSGWIGGKPSPRRQLSAELAKARSSKNKGRFDEALSIINRVLDKDPEFPDALYLKAKILWEGYENFQESKDCLRKIMQTVPREETIHHWAIGFFDEIVRTEKRRYTLGPSNKY